MRRGFRIIAAAMIMISLTAISAAAQKNQRDLEGIWTNGTITPLERPREVFEKEFLPPEEAAQYEKQVRERNHGDAATPIPTRIWRLATTIFGGIGERRSYP